MKIAHIIEAGRYGGPNKTITEICKTIKDNGSEAFVISGSECSEQFAGELDSIKIKGYFYNFTRLRFNIWIIIKYILLFFIELVQIIYILRKEKPDIIHNHTYLDFKGVIAGRLIKIPVIWQFHSSKLQRSVIPLFNVIKMIHKGQFVCVSRLTEKVFLNLKKDKKKSITIIQSPVNTNFFQPNINNVERGIVIKICCLANFHPGKGQFELIKAVKYLREKIGLNIELHLKGKVYNNHSNYFNLILNFINDNNLSKYVCINEEECVNDFLKTKDLFVLASKAEASPISVWEAASCGLPVICTDVGDVKRYIEKYKCGKVIAESDPSDISQAINTILKNNDLDVMRKKSRLMAIENFDTKIIGNKYMNLYKIEVNN